MGSSPPSRRSATFLSRGLDLGEVGLPHAVVDTHRDVHVGAVADELGQVLRTVMVPSDETGFRELERFAQGFGSVVKIGVEGTGAYGAELARWLRCRGFEVIEVDRPDRRLRRAQGKSARLAPAPWPVGFCLGRPVGRRSHATEPWGRSACSGWPVARPIRSRTQTINQLSSTVAASWGSEVGFPAIAAVASGFGLGARLAVAAVLLSPVHASLATRSTAWQAAGEEPA